MKKKDKNYITWLDLKIGSIVSQPMQRVLMENFAEKIKGKIVFELGEDTELGHLQMNFKNILEKKNDINGFIFYRLEMFLDHKRSINYDLIRETLKKGYEIHFIRQNISIRSLLDLKKSLNKFIIFESISKNKKLFGTSIYD
jgi:hypothetical protein